VLVVVVALVLTLGSGSSNKPNAGSGSATTPAQTNSASPQTTPTVGDLQVAELQVGDCLTGANLQLNNTSVPWPKFAKAVPCTKGHTAEVLYANNNYWAKNAPFPGVNGIQRSAVAACNSAFQSYVGIPFSKSIYSWIDIVAGQSTWPDGDRGLHCIAFYKTPAQPAGVTLHKSLKGAAK
jgi:hypothetical protein